MAGLVAVVGWWGNQRLRTTLEAQLRSKLTSTLDANVTALEIWTTNQMRLVTALVEEPTVHDLADRMLERAPQTSGEARRSVDRTELEQFSTYLEPRLRKLGYGMALLVDTNFVVVASSRGRMGVGLPVSEAQMAKFSELFSTGEPILITPFRPELPAGRRFGPGGRRFNGGERRGFPGRRGPFRERGTNEPPGMGRAVMEAVRRRRGDFTLMQVAAPVFGQVRTVRGALALVLRPDQEFTRILSVAQSGESGETYAFDQTGLLISGSRFDSQLRQLGLLAATNSSSALNLRLYDPGGDLAAGYKPADTNLASRPLIHMVAEAVAGENGVDVRPTRDYRGVPVVGAWRWLPQLGFGVATQIDASDAYRPLRVLQLLFVLLFLLLVLCAVGMFVFSYANLTWRRRLTEAELKLRQLGQYQIEEKIGEGGMGTVYRARHALMRRDTAVKLLLPDRADPASVERFEREVFLTCQLTHPNTIQVYDYGRTPEGVFYYAMEFLRGLNLHDLVARFGPQPEGRVIHILVQACDSLAEAHAMGLVHRDIKPANVFLCERGGIPDCVKVLDFGLVREFSGPNRERMHLTGDEGFVGTPWFMPPEAIKSSARSDPRSDIYSVGALAYYLLSGKYVFEGNSVMEIYEKQLTTPVIPLSKRTTNLVSPQLEETILRCLDKESGRRPQSAKELRQLLLSSPLAHSWSPDLRARWWANYHKLEAESALQTKTATPSPMPTVKVDVASRLK